MVVTDGGFVARNEEAVIGEKWHDADGEQQRNDEHKDHVKPTHVRLFASYSLQAKLRAFSVTKALLLRHLLLQKLQYTSVLTIYCDRGIIVTTFRAGSTVSG